MPNARLHPEIRLLEQPLKQDYSRAGARNLRCELAQKFRITAEITCRTPQREVAEIEFISVVRHVHAGRRALLDDDYRNLIGELNQAVSSITPIQTPSVGSSSSSSFGFPNSARRSPGPYVPPG
ncbi:hypothetical protein [Bradyrhizobium sp. 169]|uniref:hypothetical protein n=1 Tax=Bradyrhizobium sp. 169 TaxID=2782640 RepID=UPI001FF7C99D|nr:hypothetical protein [Bradyrhizobium sp. 169]MCK1592883.1 hypothetical protein [Bradyrhizobium sp. 169]